MAPSSAVSISRYLAKIMALSTPPHHHITLKANGEVERDAQTVKKLWRKNDSKR